MDWRNEFFMPRVQQRARARALLPTSKRQTAIRNPITYTFEWRLNNFEWLRPALRAYHALGLSNEGMLVTFG